MPTVGVQRTDFLGTESQKRPFASAFSHEKEYAEPGYYSVFLDTYGVKAELTSTERAAMHRYTFPESKESGFILDMDYNIQQQINQVMEVEAVNDTVLRGRKRSAYWAYRQDLYFMPYFPNPLRIPCTRILFRKMTNRFLYVKCFCILKRRKMNKCWLSSLSLLLMRKVLIRTSRLRCPVGIFDGVRADAKKKWNECLSKIAVKTNDEDQRAIFYTAMYHAFLSPNSVYRCRRALLGNGFESAYHRHETSGLYHFLFVGYFPCVTSVTDYCRSSVEYGVYPFIDKEASGRWYLSEMGLCVQLYRDYGGISCGFVGNRFLCEGIPRF